MATKIKAEKFVIPPTTPLWLIIQERCMSVSQHHFLCLKLHCFPFMHLISANRQMLLRPS